MVCIRQIHFNLHCYCSFLSYFVPRSSPASQTTPSCVDRIELPLQKLLFSATMTQNPEKLAPMQLYQPVLFMASEKAEPDMPKNDVETEKGEPRVSSLNQ